MCAEMQSYLKQKHYNVKNKIELEIPTYVLTFENGVSCINEPHFSLRNNSLCLPSMYLLLLS